MDLIATDAGQVLVVHDVADCLGNLVYSVHETF